MFRRKYSTKEAFEKLLELRRNKRPDNSSASVNETSADAATSAPSAGEPPQKSDGDASLRELAKKVVELISRFDEQDANSFGATVIWVDDYAEIPSFLDELYRDQMRPASQRS